MRQILFFSLLLCCLPGQTQTKDLSYGLNIYYNLSGVQRYSVHDSVPQSTFDQQKDLETVKASFAFNVFGEYTLNKKSHLSFGVGFHNTGYTLKKQEHTHFSGPIFGFDKSQTVKVKHIWHNLEVPIHYKRYFGSKNYASLGLIGQYNLSSSTDSIFRAKGLEDKISNENTTSDIRDFNLAAGVGIGRDIIVKNKFSIFLQLYGQYGIFGLNKDAAINRNLLSIGLLTGVRFN